MAKTASKKTAGVSDEAVKKATGRTWPQWFALLDRAGARKMPHREIAAVIHSKYEASSWWSQMITVGYEQARDLRKKHEKPGGFEISRSKTVAVSIGRLYSAWKDPRSRKKWLDISPLRVRTATRNKSMRLTWTDGEQILSVHFYSKGRGKSQVVVQHTKLPGARAAERMKAYWGRALTALKASLDP